MDNQRRKSEYYENGISQGAPTLTRYYLGDYEEEVSGTNVRKIHYLSGAIFIQETNQPDKFYYSYSDYQGSLIAMINEGGEIQEYAYDPWGARRNPTNWNEKDSRTSWILNRGYTGHEHIDQFGIINMNGRVYDPLTAQFFSPDPVLQAPGNWTNYNRYTYCMNNPFKYTDPSGYIMVNDEEGNYHYDAGSGAYQSRFDERGSIYYNWNSGQYEYANGEWAGFEALKNQLYSTSSYDCTYKGEKLEEIRDYLKDGYQMHHTNFYGRRGVVFSKGDPGIVTSDAGVIFINNTAYYLEGQRMAGSIGGESGGGDWIENSLKGTGFVQGAASTGNNFRNFIEMTYVNELRLDRARAGDFSRPINHQLRSIKNAGFKLNIAGGALIGADIAMSGDLKVSQGINVGMIYLSTTVWGAPIAGAWFLLDYGTMGINLLRGNGATGLGDIIDNSLGKYGKYEMYEGVY